MSKLSIHFILVILSLLFALLFAIYPFSATYNVFRPEVVCLVVLYWVMVTPDHLGVFFAFCIGMLQGVLEGGVWGAHALGLSVAVYLLERFRHRVINASLWEQSLLIGGFVIVHQLLVAWLHSIEGYPVVMRSLLLSALSSFLFWPFLMIGFARVRRGYRFIR